MPAEGVKLSGAYLKRDRDGVTLEKLERGPKVQRIYMRNLSGKRTEDNTLKEKGGARK